MPILVRRIEVGTPIQIAYHRLSQLENLSKCLCEMVEIVPAVPAGFLVHDRDSGTSLRVELCEQIPYTQIAWRCVSGWENRGRLTLALIREMPHKACRISFELDALPESLNADGYRLLSDRIEKGLEGIKRFLESEGVRP